MSSDKLDLYIKHTDEALKEIKRDIRSINEKVDSFNQFKVKVTVWVTLTATIVFSTFQLLTTIGAS